VLAQQVPRDDHAVDFGRAFADAAHPRLTVPALQRELLRHAVAAVNLHGGIDHAAEYLARIELRHGSVHAGVLAAIRLPRAGPDDPAAGARVHLRLRQAPMAGAP